MKETVTILSKKIEGLRQRLRLNMRFLQFWLNCELPFFPNFLQNVGCFFNIKIVQHYYLIGSGQIFSLSYVYSIFPKNDNLFQ